jgi:N-acetylglutamate synthase-like GNAT family acetyltransferase
MQQVFAQEEVHLKKYLTKQDITDIQALQDICYSFDKVNLKLELEYRSNLEKTISGLGQIDEFLYYHNGRLVSYLSISCFGGQIGEITGMTHPDLRRSGLFSKLFDLARAELQKRNFRKVLLLADRKSEAGAVHIL